MVEPTFRALKTGKDDAGNNREHHYFGLWDAENHSLVIAKDDWLLASGNPRAEGRLLESVGFWVGLGMPTAACLDLKAYPIEVRLETDMNQGIVRRRDSQFLWSFQR
jgi:hypothetical protein